MHGRRICFFDTNRAWGGGEKWAHDFALASVRRGARVSAVVHERSVLGERLAAHAAISLHREAIGNLSFLDPLRMHRVTSFFRRNAIEIVVLALPSDLKAGGMAARRAGVEHIVYRRGIDIPVRATTFNRHLYGRVITRLICNSEQTRRSVLAGDAALIPEERIAVLYNGFDLAGFDRADHHPLIAPSPNTLTLGTAGRLTEQKGQGLLLEAVHELRGRGLEVRLLVAGTGDLQPQLHEQVSALGLDDAVTFLGFVHEMRRFYASLDLFVLPSLWEGFGFALVEAMAARLPVVAFDVSSNPEILADEVTGLLARPGDAHDLAEKIGLLAQDEDLRRRMGARGRQRVVDVFELERCFDQFAALFPVSGAAATR